jgi:hypothetical protein
MIHGKEASLKKKPFVRLLGSIGQIPRKMTAI